MEFRDLRTLAAVIELRGITRAARRLHLVQSAVSQAVKRLEREYGLLLLERRSDGVYPTAAGVEFVRHANRIIDELTRLDEDMASFRRHEKGVVNIGMASSIAARVISPLVRAFSQQFPDVTLQVKEGRARELLEALRLERLDIVALLSPVEIDGFAVVEVGALELCFIVPPEHPFAERKVVPFAAAANEAWISFPLSNPARRWLEENSRKAGFRPVIAAEIDTFTQMMAFVQADAGITLAPRELVAPEIELGLLVAVPCSEPRITTGIVYVHRPEDERSLVAAARLVLEAQLRALITSAPD